MCLLARRCIAVVVLFAGLWLVSPRPFAADRDLDGRSDDEEIKDGTNPNDPASVRPARLAHWNFDDPAWLPEGTRVEVEARGVSQVPGLNGSAVAMVGIDSRPMLRFRPVPSERVILTAHSGTVRFMFRPTWASRDPMAPPGFSWGKGPGHKACLFEVATGEGQAPLPLLGVWFNPNGTELTVLTRAQNAGVTTNYAARVSWTARQDPRQPDAALKWHEIGLAWSPFGTTLIVDGAHLENQAAHAWNGSPLQLGDPRKLVLTLGNSGTGDAAAEGGFDELETLNFPMTPLESHTLLARTALSAECSTTPPSVTLRWYGADGTAETVRRRDPETTNWTVLARDVKATVFTDRDAALNVGRVYEYGVGERTLLVGLNASPVEHRGRVLLLVDETRASGLRTELERLRLDLIGDGWTVTQREVPRHDDHAWDRQAINPAYKSALEKVKSLIQVAYAEGPDPLKAVFLIGHVVVPYSGVGHEDGHLEHNGAWPADAYYGDLDAQWSDSVMNTGTNIANPVLRNVPGDGKLDPYEFNQTLTVGGTTRLNGVEVAVGRVDFANLPAFAPRSETDLLRQYLVKDHRYRLGAMPFDAFMAAEGYFSEPFHGECYDIYDTASVILSRSVGVPWPAAVHGDCFASPRSVLWGLQGGYGGGDTINNVPQINPRMGTATHNTAELAQAAGGPRVGFYVLKGSYFGDWNLAPNNLMRAVLATRDYGLAAVFTRSFVWHFDPLAVGDTLGAGFVRTARGGVSTRTVYLLGDPTLRAPVLRVPVNASGRRNGPRVTLTWTQSDDAAIGYEVYRSTGDANGPFTRLTATPLAAGTFTDADAGSGSRTYGLRAVKLTATGAGAYTNLSQMVYLPVN